MRAIRDPISQGKYSEAISQIAARLKESQIASDDGLSLSKLIDQIPTEHFSQKNYLTKKLAVLGGYTTQYLSAWLKVAALKEGIYLEVFETDYGLFEQAIYS